MAKGWGGSMEELKQFEAVWSNKTRTVNAGQLIHCDSCHSTLDNRDAEAHAAFHTRIIDAIRKAETMSKVLWCDERHHAYKAGEPGSAAMTATMQNDKGEPVTVERHACAAHNPLRAQPENIVRELNSEYPIAPNND